MKLFIFIFLILSKSAISQSGVKEIYKYSNKDCLVFDYSTLSTNFLINKHFGISESNEEQIYKTYKLLNVTKFSPNGKIGEFVSIDTIFFDSKISFSEVNFAVKSFLSNNINFNILENKFGYYLINVILRHKNYSDDIFRVSIKVRSGYVIMESNSDLYINSSYLMIPKIIAYNDKSEALKYEQGEQLFISHIAKEQIYYYSVLYETIERLKFQVNQYFIDILNKKQ